MEPERSGFHFCFRILKIAVLGRWEYTFLKDLDEFFSFLMEIEQSEQVCSKHGATSSDFIHFRHNYATMHLLGDMWGEPCRKWMKPDDDAQKLRACATSSDFIHFRHNYQAVTKTDVGDRILWGSALGDMWGEPCRKWMKPDDDAQKLRACATSSDFIHFRHNYQAVTKTDVGERILWGSAVGTP
eukprot:gene14221-biopygen376